MVNPTRFFAFIVFLFFSFCQFQIVSDTVLWAAVPLNAKWHISRRLGGTRPILQRFEGDFFPLGKVSENVFPANPKPVITVLPRLRTVTFC
jgi:hypothetical protein